MEHTLHAYHTNSEQNWPGLVGIKSAFSEGMTDPDDRHPSTAGEEIETHCVPSLGSTVRRWYPVREGRVTWGTIHIGQVFGPGGSSETMSITFFDEDPRGRR